MSLSRINHYSSAIQLRTSLLIEAFQAKSGGSRLPKGIINKIWKDPQIHEDYIWFLRFIPNTNKVTLIDIGGNSGYWAQTFLEYYPDSVIYAFEPVKEMYNQYVTRFENNHNVKVFNTALGALAEEKEINVAKGFGLTSFNTYGDYLDDKNMHFIAKEKVIVDSLDKFNSEITFHSTIIKVDVQGFETFVIEGGLDVFKKADLALIECSFVNEFKNQLPTFGEVTKLLLQVDLHPVKFGVFDKNMSSFAYERNVLFINSKYFNKIWNS